MMEVAQGRSGNILCSSLLDIYLSAGIYFLLVSRFSLPSCQSDVSLLYLNRD